MPYLILAYDHPGMEAEREAARELHRAHLASASNNFLATGVILDEDGRTIVGGMTLLDTEDRATAHTFAHDDPYQSEGIRKQTEILPWRKRWWMARSSAKIRVWLSPVEYREPIVVGAGRNGNTALTNFGLAFGVS